MLKSIFLLLITLVLFSGCHRYHGYHGYGHNVRTVISPTVVFKPFHFRSKYHHKYRRNYRNHYKNYSHRHRRH